MKLGPAERWMVEQIEYDEFSSFLFLLFLFLLWILNVLLSADCSTTGAEGWQEKNRDFVVSTDFTVLITTGQIIYSVLPSAANLAPGENDVIRPGP